jgi:hypothetical protein
LILNQGTEPVLNDFWVDMYVNPVHPPTGVNQIWESPGEQGIAWGVSSDLAPGEVLPLTSTGPNVIQQYPNFDGVDPGDALYIQVDSTGTDSGFGSVVENHEIAGAAYNYIARYTVTTGDNGIATFCPELEPTAPIEAELPRRPVQ